MITLDQIWAMCIGYLLLTSLALAFFALRGKIQFVQKEIFIKNESIVLFNTFLLILILLLSYTVMTRQNIDKMFLALSILILWALIKFMRYNTNSRN